MKQEIPTAELIGNEGPVLYPESVNNSLCSVGDNVSSRFLYASAPTTLRRVRDACKRKSMQSKYRFVSPQYHPCLSLKRERLFLPTLKIRSQNKSPDLSTGVNH